MRQQRAIPFQASETTLRTAVHSGPQSRASLTNFAERLDETPAGALPDSENSQASCSLSLAQSAGANPGTSKPTVPEGTESLVREWFHSAPYGDEAVASLTSRCQVKSPQVEPAEVRSLGPSEQLQRWTNRNGNPTNGRSNNSLGRCFYQRRHGITTKIGEICRIDNLKSFSR